MKIDVLPGSKGPGFVRLVTYMQPASRGLEIGKEKLDALYTEPIQDDWFGDLEIVRNARVSYDADWRTGEDEGKDAKLISYLLKNHHTSPFESMVFTFEVKAPIFVLRQWHRHRTWSYNEISARYTELDEGFYVPDADKITAQSKDNKQMRTNETHHLARIYREAMENQGHAAFEQYKAMLETGCPRELARTILPLSTYSRMFATVDLHNLLHFLRLRLHEHSQYEIRVYAEALLALIEPVVPCTVSKFKEIQSRA